MQFKILQELKIGTWWDNQYLA